MSIERSGLVARANRQRKGRLRRTEQTRQTGIPGQQRGKNTEIATNDREARYAESANGKSQIGQEQGSKDQDQRHIRTQCAQEHQQREKCPRQQEEGEAIAWRDELQLDHSSNAQPEG